MSPPRAASRSSFETYPHISPAREGTGKCRYDRRLMREAQVNLAIRWFAGYALHEKLPDHSSLTRIRQRWGPERFKTILSRTVEACLTARIATGEVIHLDATLIRANVSWDAIVEAHADAVLSELDNTSAPSPEVVTTSKTQRICRTDPDASLGKGGRLPRVEPAYKQQTAVDAKKGVILDVEVTTGGVHDSKTLSALDEVPRPRMVRPVSRCCRYTRDRGGSFRPGRREGALGHFSKEFLEAAG